MSAHPTIRVAVLFAVGLLAPAVVFAQGNKPDMEKVRASGTVKGVVGNVLLVVTEDGDQYRVKAPDKPDYIIYNASADPSWLAPGMWVSFSTKVDKKGQPVAPLTRLTVFTPQKDTQFGIIPDALAGGSDLFADKEEPKPGQETIAVSVNGRIASARNNSLTIAAGRAAIKVEVSDNAQVSVNVSQLNLLREGDKVSIEGWFLPQQKRDIVANRLTISASEKLGEKKTPPAEQE